MIKSTSMGILNRYPAIWAIVLVMIITGIGSYFGHQAGVHDTTEIARTVRAENPKDPLDMLWIIGFGYWVGGTLVGGILGIGCGIVLYFWLRYLNQRERIKLNQQRKDAVAARVASRRSDLSRVL